MKIILADDHTLFREGLHYVLQALQPGITVLEAADHSGVIAQFSQHPDAVLALVDLDMPGRGPEGSALDDIERLMGQTLTLPVVVVSACEDTVMIRGVLAAGAMGFIPKRECSAVMLSALRLVLAGGVYVPPVLLADASQRVSRTSVTPLTPRQLEVLSSLAEGHSNKVIARKLSMSEATVKAHTSAILRSLNVSSRAQAVRAARRLGLLVTE